MESRNCSSSTKIITETLTTEQEKVSHELLPRPHATQEELKGASGPVRLSRDQVSSLLPTDNNFLRNQQRIAALLHIYNDVKDAAQKALHALALKRRCSMKEVYHHMGVALQ